MEELYKNFRPAIIKKSMCLIGEPEFEERSFASLQVGDYITQIGTGGYKSGGQTSTAQLSDFDPPVQYAGRIHLPHAYDDKQMVDYIAFRLPADGVTGWPEGVKPETVYMLFIIGHNETELYVPWLSTGGPSIRIYQAGFAKLAVDPAKLILTNWMRSGAKLFDFGKICNDCAFKIQPDINNYSGAVESAMHALCWEGTFNCHTADYQDTGKTCIGFQYARAYTKHKWK
jgi:hypothetical protein